VRGPRLLVPLAAAVVLGTSARGSGTIVVIGGGDAGAAVLGRFVEAGGGASGRFVVLPMASSDPTESGKDASGELRGAGARDVTSLVLTRDTADVESALGPLRGASGIFFTGGDQARLTAVLKGTKAEALLHERLRLGAALAGTSAGAAVMSAVMITGEERRPDPNPDYPWAKIEADDVVTSPGFGFIPGVIVDQHFVRRRRSNRLLSLVLENPELLGVGIDERTAIVYKEDRTFEVVGPGAVLVVDAKHSRVRREGEGLEGEGVTLHILREGSRYDVRSRRVLRLGAGGKGS
jgi:cyanophycinase